MFCATAESYRYVVNKFFIAFALVRGTGEKKSCVRTLCLVAGRITVLLEQSSPSPADPGGSFAREKRTCETAEACVLYRVRPQGVQFGADTRKQRAQRWIRGSNEARKTLADTKHAVAQQLESAPPCALGLLRVIAIWPPRQKMGRIELSTREYSEVCRAAQAVGHRTRISTAAPAPPLIPAQTPQKKNTARHASSKSRSPG